MCDCFFIMRIYNTKPWLAEAIESVLNQTNSSLKLFLFDNGSTDGCKEICEYYKNKDNRVILYRTEENRHYSDLESQSVIRNAFLESKANYFSFVDSDDWYSVNYLDTVLNIADKKNADIVVAGWNRIDKEGTLLEGKVEPIETTIVKRRISYDEMSFLYTVFHTMWGKLYRAKMYESYWNSIKKLPANASNGGDIYMMRYILTEADTITCISDTLYFWRKRHTTNTYTPFMDNSWLYLMAVRNYDENVKFFSKFCFSKKDRRKIEKWNGKLAYADITQVCKGIINDPRSYREKADTIYQILMCTNLEDILQADWRNSIVLYYCIKSIEKESEKDVEKIASTVMWKKIEKQSNLAKRIVFKFKLLLTNMYFMLSRRMKTK